MARQAEDSDPAPGAMYEIRVQGHLDPGRSGWLGEMDIENRPDGVALLTGRVADQAALHGLLARIRDMNLTLIAVTRR